MGWRIPNEHGFTSFNAKGLAQWATGRLWLEEKLVESLTSRGSATERLSFAPESRRGCESTVDNGYESDQTPAVYVSISLYAAAASWAAFLLLVRLSLLSSLFASLLLLSTLVCTETARPRTVA